jgi:DNA polymerase sigma
LIKTLGADLVRFAKELEDWQASVEGDYAKATGTIEAAIKHVWGRSEVKIFGSYSTKLHLPSSDIDLVILSSEGSLEDLYEVLKRTPGVEQLRLINSAVIPVLKLAFRQDHLKLQIDVTLQNSLHRGLKASEFVRRVLSQSELVKPIFMAFKQLFYWVDCHEAYKGGLSSYSLFLMIACFLQNHRATSLAETFVTILTYLANDCDYSQPFIACDPAQPETLFNLRPVSCT